jgi:hypothetical protein
MTTAQHLAHLLWLMSPPFTQAWKVYAWARAKEIAADPEHADLPRLLAEAMQGKDTAIPTTE